MRYDASRDLYVIDSLNMSPLDKLAVEAQNHANQLRGNTKAMSEYQIQCNALAAERDNLLAERERIAQLLATLWETPISISSIQPLMDLARELNPRLR